jgi:hypothetical protein
MVNTKDALNISGKRINQDIGNRSQVWVGLEIIIAAGFDKLRRGKAAPTKAIALVSIIGIFPVDPFV